MENIYKNLSLIEAEHNIFYLRLSFGKDVSGEHIALIRSSGQDLLFFSDALAAKVITAMAEHYAEEDTDNFTVESKEFDAAEGVQSLLFCFGGEINDSVELKLSNSVLY